jgi:hypothetical protein
MLERFLAVALTLTGSIGCEQALQEVPRGTAQEADVREAAGKARMPIYFLGEAFAGLPLTDVHGGERGATVVYGRCKLPRGEGGCAPPIQIQHFAFASAGWSNAVGCRGRPSLRGVPTVRHDGLVLVTRDGLVKIYARGPAEDRRVALALRRPGERAGPLPPPTAAEAVAVRNVCR